MGRILAFVNQKGGVGKTTSAVNLAAALQKAGKKVLLCDFDPQANATSGLGVEKSAAAHSTYELVIDGFPAADAVIHTPYCDVLASNVALSGAGVELVGMDAREYALKHALEPLRAQYDYIFIDCPPSLELLTLNALCAADQVLIPVQCEYYALEGLSDLMVTLRAVKKRLNPTISIFGVLLTMYDGRTNFSAQVAEEVRRHFPGKVFAAAIPRNVRLSEAPSHGMPVCAYDKFSRGAAAYDAVAQEILAKESESEELRLWQRKKVSARVLAPCSEISMSRPKRPRRARSACRCRRSSPIPCSPEKPSTRTSSLRSPSLSACTASSSR